MSIASGCGLSKFQDVPLDRKISPDGRFETRINGIETDPLSHDIQEVTINKVHSNWKDTVTLNRSAEAWSFQGNGEVSIDWADSSHLVVICSGCEKPVFGLKLDEWQGIVIEYKHKDAPPHSEPDKPGRWRLSE